MSLSIHHPEGDLLVGQLNVTISRIKNPSAKNTWYGTEMTKFVSIKNVVYREIFDPHSQIEPMEDIDEICSLLNDNVSKFPTNHYISSA